MVDMQFVNFYDYIEKNFGMKNVNYESLYRFMSIKYFLKLYFLIDLFKILLIFLVAKIIKWLL